MLEAKQDLRYKVNSKRYRKKHDSEGSSASTGPTSLEAELKKLIKQVDWMEKSHVEPLLEKVEPPFTKDILEAPLLAKFKMPQIKLYEREGDPTEHLETFKSWMELQGTTWAAMCRAFSLTFIGATNKWYRKLKPGYISLFTQLSQMFISQFVRARDHQLPPTHFIINEVGEG